MTTLRFRTASAAACVLVLGLAPRAEGQESITLFVPVVLSSSGLGGSFFTSELVETNRGTIDTIVTYQYAAVTGGGSGTVTNSTFLQAGRQRIIPDAIVYLRSLGLAIPTGVNAVGTLRVTFSSLSSVAAAAITVRTTTPVPVGAPTGRAGLAYSALQPTSLLRGGTAYLAGLRQSSQDRTNVAVQNAGATGDGNITLHLTFIPSEGTPGTGMDVTLAPGGFEQLALTAFDAGASAGSVRIERTAGSALYYAYAVINDQVNSDGSFLTPVVVAETLDTAQGIVLPTVVETSVFSTEVVVSNLTSSPQAATLTCVSSSFGTASFPITLDPYEQRTYPDFIQALRSAGILGIPAVGATITGALTLTTTGDITAFFLGGRTLNAGGGGRYGVFTTGQQFATGFFADTWLYGLRQDSENRTNVALVNMGDVDATPSQLQIEIYDGSTGALVKTVKDANTLVGPGAFKQINSILSAYAPGTTQGYARITSASGDNTNILYAVVNDGAQPGQRSGDGAVIPMTPFEEFHFTGRWHNTTFGTFGDAANTALLQRTTFQIQTTLTLQGNVFGSGPTGSQTFLGAFDTVGNLTIAGASPVFGPLTALIDTGGNVSGSALSIPSPNVSSMTFSGTTSSDNSSVNLNYSVNLKPSGTAQGTLDLTIVPNP